MNVSINTTSLSATILHVTNVTLSVDPEPKFSTWLLGFSVSIVNRVTQLCKFTGRQQWLFNLMSVHPHSHRWAVCWGGVLKLHLCRWWCSTILDIWRVYTVIHAWSRRSYCSLFRRFNALQEFFIDWSSMLAGEEVGGEGMDIKWSSPMEQECRRKKMHRRSNQNLNLGLLSSGQMLLPTEPLELWHWSNGRWYIYP